MTFKSTFSNLTTVTDITVCCYFHRAFHISPPTDSAVNGSWAGSANPVGRHTRHSGAWWWWRAESTRRRGAHSSPQGPALFGHLPPRAWRCTENNTHTSTHTCCLVAMWQQSRCKGDMAELTGVNTALGHWCGRRHCVPHVVLPLNRHIHLIHSALRNGPCWNKQTHPWGAKKRQTHKQTDIYRSCELSRRLEESLQLFV